MNGELYHALSINDINDFFNDNVTVITSDKLCKVKNIDDLLRKSNRCIILYLFKENYGHYCALVRNGKKIYYVDSFGRLPDSVNSDISDSDFRSQHHLDYKYLTDLLLNSPYEVEYNQKTWQDDKTSVCGRYAILCCCTLINDIKLTDLQKIFNRKNKMKNDELVIKLTE